eukprot:NODE_3147_length_1037_cov_32.221660_g2893_i0.p2 GENE.NODE_3147_length_1037_cov_32.221660_g2893_i0~~NODE_3147_length_1037_cov_32.221660_g2893_i0.p2  ORF type:complete len:139 (+),score=17.89 NODE_3147_length_1037_cov_32.221660_g2893_i0:494-910(+)
MARFFFEWVETGLRLQRESLQRRKRDVRGTVLIYDLKGVTRQQLDLRGIRVLASFIRTGQQHYPENLDRAIVINAPALFAVPWSIIQRVVSQRTRHRVTVRRDGGRDALLELMSPEHLDRVLRSVDTELGPGTSHPAA